MVLSSLHSVVEFDRFCWISPIIGRKAAGMSWAFEKHMDKVLFCGGGCGVVRQSYCKELAWWEGGECFLGGRAGVV